MTVLDFIKSLFIPKHMKRFKDMSALFAICLFILGMYAVIFPTEYYYKREAHNLVVEDDLYYLHSILEIPTAGEDLEKFVSDIKENKGISLEGVIKTEGLALNKISTDESIIGVISKGESNWMFNFTDTNIVINTESGPNVSATDNGIVIENVTDKAVSVNGLNKDDNIVLVKIEVTDRGLLKVNDKTYDNILITNKNPLFTMENNKLCVDGVATDFGVYNNEKVVLYFIPNAQLSYYETSYSYKNDKGIQNNIKFIIDLDVKTINDCTYEYKEELHPNINDEAYYFITVTNTFIAFQANPKGIEELNIKRNDVNVQTAIILTYYANSAINFEDMFAANFGTYMTEKFEAGYIVLVVQTFNLTAFIFCLIYPLIITLLFSLLFKRNGRLKTFKEYYNIASIANIVPTLIAFVLMWFNPMLFTSLYLFVFAVYYLFVLYRINNSPEAI